MARILLIDDESGTRITLAEILETDGHEIRQAGHGVDGMRILETEFVDLVVTDILMPEKEGVETILEVRRSWPTIPIVAISGGGLSGNLSFLEIARKLGADRVLPKPIRMETLIGTVRELLSAMRDNVPTSLSERR